jgi:aminoglycoside phosphotransferase (APT) family kinase protein
MIAEACSCLLSKGEVKNIIPPWSSERVVSNRLAVHLIEDQFPQSAPVRLVEFGKGFDNTAYLVNDGFIFRFPRREIAVELLKTEKVLLPFLVPILPLPIPEPVYDGHPSKNYPWPFIGYKLVKGEMPGELTANQRIQSAEPLAAFLRKLHNYPVEQAKSLGVPNDQLDRLSISKRKLQHEENVHQLMADGILRDDPLLTDYLLSLQHVEPDSREVLAHGDLHLRNLLVNEKSVLAGIIDWGDAHIGHPAVDLAVIYQFLPPQGRRIFIDIYGEVDEQTEKLARFRAIHSTIWLLRYGCDNKDEKLITAAKESLHLALME